MRQPGYINKFYEELELGYPEFKNDIISLTSNTINLQMQADKIDTKITKFLRKTAAKAFGSYNPNNNSSGIKNVSRKFDTLFKKSKKLFQEYMNDSTKINWEKFKNTRDEMSAEVELVKAQEMDQFSESVAKKHLH